MMQSSIALILALSAHLAWAGDRQIIPSPDKLVVATILTAKTGESEVVIGPSHGMAKFTKSFVSSDGEHGAIIGKSQWSADARFFVFILEYSGGHSPMMHPIYFWDRQDDKLRPLDRAIGGITGGFTMEAPDLVHGKRVARPGMDEEEFSVSLSSAEKNYWQLNPPLPAATANNLTPLMDAAYKCNPAKVFELLNDDADCHEMDKNGKSALDWARIRGCDETVGLLMRCDRDDFPGWRKVQEIGERYLRETSSKKFPTGNLVMAKAAVPVGFADLFETEKGRIKLPPGFVPKISVWKADAGPAHQSWIVEFSLYTRDSSTAAFYSCGFTMIGNDEHPPAIVAENQCILNYGDEMLGHQASPIAVVNLPISGSAVLFRWFGDHESGRWLYIKGHLGWQRIANTLDVAD